MLTKLLALGNQEQLVEASLYQLVSQVVVAQLESITDAVTEVNGRHEPIVPRRPPTKRPNLTLCVKA